MPRAARKKSESGFYHVLLRGIGKQSIFEDDEDRIRFIETLGRYKEELNFEIHAYCLMKNHVHILLKDINRQLDLIMKKAAGSYAWYYNWKYERVGHLFQDRYKSETIEDDAYFLTVLRYIHQNPQKAGVGSTDEFRWSSYSEYINEARITDTKAALEMMGGKDAFIQFMKEENEELCLDLTEKIRLTDELAAELIKETANIEEIQQIQALERGKRDEVLAELNKKGLSIRHIERLTGINRGVVLKACCRQNRPLGTI